MKPKCTCPLKGTTKRRAHTTVCSQFQAATCHPHRGHWIRGMCQPCYNESQRAKRRKDSQVRGEVHAADRRHRLRSRYGISVDEYDKILASQNGVCAICRRLCRTGRNLAVDHDHHTDQIRGLLCVNCNQMLGAIDDDVDLLERAIDYLLKYRTQPNGLGTL